MKIPFIKGKILSKKDEGYMGERMAEKFLKRKGIKIIDRNFNIRGGEIDLIGEKEGITIFIEVKTRSNNSFGTAGESINYLKRKSLRKTALFYLKKKGKPLKARFDAIYVYLNPSKRLKSIDWLKNIFPFEE